MERRFPRSRVDGIPIGCPALYGEAPCHPCGGGWPGTLMLAEDMIAAAKKGKLNSEKLACGTLRGQGEFLIKKFNGVKG